MHSRQIHNGITWIDLENPTREEARTISEQFDIEPRVAEELLLPSGKPRAEFFDAYMYVILHFPALRHTHTTLEQEVDFIVGKDFIVTAHYDTIDPLHKFSKLFEATSLAQSGATLDHAGYIFQHMLSNLYKAVEYEVDDVRQDLSKIEEHIFSQHHVEMVAAISKSARDLLNLRQTIEPHREVLHELEHRGASLFGTEFVPYLRTLSNHYYRVHNHIMRETESLHELRETNNSLLTTKQNETMRIFTILAFVTFPLSLIVEILSMKTESNPIVGLTHDFWLIISIMAGAALVMFWYFKRKKWL